LQASFAAHKLYGDKTKLSPTDIDLYNKLLEEMNQIEEEQKRLWNHVHVKKLSNTELERKFRTSIINMQNIMPTVQRKLEMEIVLLENDIKTKSIQRDKFIRDMNRNIKNAHGNEKLKAELELQKNEESIARLQEINDLRINLSKMKVAYEGSLKNQHQMNQEAHDRKEQINKQIEELKEQKKEIRRKANEERHQENIQRQQEQQTPKEETPIVSISKPKNKKSLKEKLKKVVLAVVAAATLATGMLGLTTRKNNQEVQTMPSESSIVQVMEDESVPTETPTTISDESDEVIRISEQDNIVISQDTNEVAPEQNKDVKNDTVKYNDETIKSEENNYQSYSEPSKLWSTVSIKNQIYTNMTSAINETDALTPYFNQDKEYTVVGVTYSNGSDTKTIYTSTFDAEEQESLLQMSGYSPVEYLISSKTTEEVDFTNLENIQKNATGHVSANDIIEINQNQGRSK
jgi:hypothetical protein